MRRRAATGVAAVAAAGLVAAGVLHWRGGAPDAALAHEVARGLIAAAPPADPGDEGAQGRAARALGALRPLGTAFAETIIWGAKKPGVGFAPSDNHTTQFDPGVFVRLYLSLFWFPGEYSIERHGDFTVLRIAVRFRNGLDPGRYPYPFWHAARKWDAYERCRDLLFVFERGRAVAIYRSVEEDESRPHVPRTFDGKWRWPAPDGVEEPRVTLFSSFLSPGNPHAGELDAAFRTLEGEMRLANCSSCHAPDNTAKMNPLSLLIYPAQALGVRHEILRQVDADKMPPKDEPSGRPAGVHDAAAKARLVELARAFAAAGDRALAAEGGALGPQN